jgi:hypothetical protein
MAGNVVINNEAARASAVSDADVWAALDQLEAERGGAGEETQARSEGRETEDMTDIGHGAEVQGAQRAEESAGGENAGDDEEAAEAAPGQSEEEPSQEEEEEEENEDEERADEGVLESEDETEAVPKGIREMEKRIGKLTHRSKSLEEENASLRGQLEKAQPIILKPSPEDPLAHLNSAQAVLDQVESMHAYKEWAELHRDGGELLDKEGKARELDAQEVAENVNKANRIIRLAPKRLEYLARKERFDALCQEVYPELFQANSPESQVAWAFVRENPGILRLPQYALIIGDAIRGGRLREEEQKAKKAKTEAARPTLAKAGSAQKLAPRAISPGAAKSVRGNSASQAHQRFLETGSKRDLDAYFERTL